MGSISNKYKVNPDNYVTSLSMESTYATIKTTDSISSDLNTTETNAKGKEDMWEPSSLCRYMSSTGNPQPTGIVELDATASDTWVIGDDPISASSSGYIYLPPGYMYEIVLTGGFINGTYLMMEVYHSLLGDGHPSSHLLLNDSTASWRGGSSTAIYTYDLRNTTSSDTIYANVLANKGSCILYGSSTTDRSNTSITATQIARKSS